MTSRFKDYIPEFEYFTKQLAIDYVNGHLTENSFRQRCDIFYTNSMMQKIDAVTTAWIVMASYQQGATLYHVTSVLVALYLLPEYQSATKHQQALMEWTVLFHDVAKVPVKNGHDYVHGFKSTAIAGKALTKLGFPLKQGQTKLDLDTWADLTHNAIIYDAQHAEYIQDNSKLEKIIENLKQLHSNDAYCILTAILFHISIRTDPNYPILAPLSDNEIRQYITPDSLAIIKAMILVDNDGWCLFDRDTQQQRRKQTLMTFEQFVTPLVLSP
ncbi:MAG: hypothetical protein Phog2KO_36010 [Phototrophicaceae bacterium]